MSDKKVAIVYVVVITGVLLCALLVIWKQVRLRECNNLKDAPIGRYVALSEQSRGTTDITMIEYINIVKAHKEFLKNHLGHIVRWKGVVASVSKEPNVKNGNYLVQISSSSEKDSGWAYCWFRPSNADQLLTLATNMEVEVCGVLDDCDIEHGARPILYNCTLGKHVGQIE